MFVSKLQAHAVCVCRAASMLAQFSFGNELDGTFLSVCNRIVVFCMRVCVCVCESEQTSTYLFASE